MKTYKKIISMFLALIFFMLIPLSQVLAFSNSNSYVITESATIISKNLTQKLVSKDLANGDAEFNLYSNGVLVASSTLYRSKNSIIEKNYSNGRIVSENTKMVPVLNSSTKVMTSNGYSRLGRIRYQYYDTVTSGICGAYVDYQQTINNSAKFDLTGYYQNIASLASFIAGLLALPAGIASQVAGFLLSIFSLGSAAYTGFNLPHTQLTSQHTSIGYKVTDIQNSSHYNTFSGSKYYITESGKHQNQTYYTGDFYPLSDYTNRNVTFAMNVYDHLFSYNYYSVYDWS